MAVIFEMANSASTGSGGTNDHVNLDLGGPTTDGIDRLVIVVVAWSDDTVDGAATSLVQYGGIDMTFHSSRSAGGGNLEIYYLTDNRPGTLGITVQWSPNPPNPTALIFATVGVVAFKYVTPQPAVPFNFTQTAAIATPSLVVDTRRSSTVSRHVFHTAVVIRSPLASEPTITTDAGQTLVWNNGADDGTTGLQCQASRRIWDGSQKFIVMRELFNNKTASWASTMVAINESIYPAALLC